MTEIFDYLVVGAGASGCAVAGRLAAVPGTRVAVLEAGRAGRLRIEAIPAATIHTNGNPFYDWKLVSQPDPSRFDRTEDWPRGLGPGGSTRINGMIFVRGAPEDFDAWRDLGARGWGYRDVLPYFRRIETSTDAGSQVRGATGPLRVSPLPYVHDLTPRFIAAAGEAGLPFNPDINGERQDGIGYVQSSARRGRRHDSFTAFLKPAIAGGAAVMLEGARARRVIFEGGRATGVEFEQDGVVRTVVARKGVILSGGAIHTPQLLMLSGIGPAARLGELGIPVVTDAPEVGRNLMEHVGIWMGLKVSVPTLNQQVNPMGMARAMLLWLAGKGPAAAPTAQAVGFARTLAGLPSPDIQIHLTPFGHIGRGAERKLAPFPMVSVVASVNHPRSRGRIDLASSDPAAAPLIYPTLLEAPEDLATLRRGVELCGRIVDAPAFRDFVEERIGWPDLSADDAEAERQIRSLATPIYHPVGTCRMGSDAASVVDPELKVRGVDGLFVADASIMPRHISGNTQAVAMMIGDKAADLIGTPL
ncbi:MAG: GMC family oxidoreductase N-terminal domain-containing protein [Pseudomonadota bacterium]|jgi:choline dehydrogenase|uniref:Choline dehydrogenase n=1 Tax=hydrothermal vent metagenome TaxID=652676 RepID=A0A160TPY8_9ZZZZ